MIQDREARTEGPLNVAIAVCTYDAIGARERVHDVACMTLLNVRPVSSAPLATRLSYFNASFGQLQSCATGCATGSSQTTERWLTLNKDGHQIHFVKSFQLCMFLGFLEHGTPQVSEPFLSCFGSSSLVHLMLI